MVSPMRRVLSAEREVQGILVRRSVVVVGMERRGSRFAVFLRSTRNEPLSESG
jgi:hypothetical protein